MRKIIDLLKNRKLLSLALLLSFLSVIYIVASLGKKTPTNSTSASPINIYPPDGSNPTLLFPATAISFFFEKPVLLELYRVQISPNIEFDMRLSADRESLNVSPKVRWFYDTTYTISLLDPRGVLLTKTTVTFKDPKKNPPVIDEHPPGGI